MNPFNVYWKEVFGEFEREKGIFSIPGFPEPMMSVDFNSLPGDVYIYTINKSRARKESLEEASQSPRFWKFLEEQYPESVSFLERLIPFLVQNNHPHFHYYIEIESQLVASQLVGFNSEMSFLFNGVVHKDYRNRKLLSEIVDLVRTEIPSEKAFYWTKHEWLKL